MTNPSIIQIIAAGLFSVLITAGPSPLLASDRPNIIVLLSDDLGAYDLSSYGGPVETPTLDSLANSGARFKEFYAPATVCSPSRASLLTGRHHIRSGVYSWIHNSTQKSHLLEEEITLAEVLKQQGYSTAHFGKWHLGLPTDERDKPSPLDHGFDYWFGTENNAEPSHRNPVNFLRDGEPVGEIEGYSCQIVVDDANRWLDDHQKQDKPFFLNIWFHEPHLPIAAPDRIVSKYGDLSDRAAIYSGTIDNTDQAIARLIEKLKALGVYENTLIIYSSDNGSYRPERNGELRGKKTFNWEGGIRVPGIFSWPGHILAQNPLEDPAGIIDILPTVCGLLNIEKPTGVHLDGTDLSAYLTGQAPTIQREQPMFWHLQMSRPIVALRDGNYSLVADPDYDLPADNYFQEAWIPRIKSGGYQNYRLYDLSKDPNQQHNIASEYPEKLEKLKAKLNAINESIMHDGVNWNEK